jgi:hypothetical protein
VIAFEHQHLSRFSHRFAMYLGTGSESGWERQEVAFLQTLRDRNSHIGNRARIERAVLFYSKSCSGPSLFSLFEPKLNQAGADQISLRSLAIFLNGSLSVLALRRTAKMVRFRALAIVSALLALKTSSRSSVSRSGVQGRRGVPVIFPAPSAHLQLFQPDFYQDYLQLSGT